MPVHFEIRVLLLSAQPQAYLKALDQEGLFLCGIVPDRILLSAQLPRLQPHVLLADAPAAGLDTLCVRLMPACPPRIADAPAASAALAVQNAMQPPVSPLAEPTLPLRLSHARTLLAAIGMPETLRGYADIALGAAWLSAWPQPAPALRHSLYPWLARHAGTSPAAIERRIRSAIESAWLHGSLQAQNAFFGLSISPERGKPTNAEFLYRLADAISARITARDYTV